jgi:hypothetical protein
VAYLSEKGLKSTCGKGGGTFQSTEHGHACNYKNGNIRDCNRTTKTCVVTTPSRTIGSPFNGIAKPGLLEASPGLSTTGPSATGAPAASPVGAAPSFR